MWHQSLGLKDPLEKGMATHSSIHGQRSLAGYRPQGCKESDTNKATQPAHMQSYFRLKDNVGS